MYHLANQSRRLTRREGVVLVNDRDPTECIDRSFWTDGNDWRVPAPQTFDDEAERHRLLQNLQASSNSKLRLTKTFRYVNNHEYDEENQSTSSTPSIRSWWHRTRNKIGKASRNPSRFNIFRKRRKKKHQSDYNNFRQSLLPGFFDFEPKSNELDESGTQIFRTDTRPKGNNGNTIDVDDDGNKTVVSQNSLSSFLRSMLPKKKHGDRKLTLREPSDKAFSTAETHRSGSASRPTMKRRGSILINRVFRSESTGKLSTSHSWSCPCSAPIPDRLTPITTAILSDREDDDYSDTVGYGTEDTTGDIVVEQWRDEDTMRDNDDPEEDDDDEIVQLSFRPIEPPAPIPVHDRWSPSPSPSLDAERAPRLPLRCPMPDEEEVEALSSKQVLLCVDDSDIYPSPSPVRATPTPSSSNDSSIVNIVGNAWPTLDAGSSVHTQACKPMKDIVINPSMSHPRILPIKPNFRHSVSFGNIEVREYERVVGDNPSCTRGPPIAIGWGYKDMPVKKLEEFEGARLWVRDRRDLHLSVEDRVHMLVNDWNFSMDEVDRASHDVRRVQKNRFKSIGGVARKQSQDQSNIQLPSSREEPTALRHSPTPAMMMHLSRSQTTFPGVAKPA